MKVPVDSKKNEIPKKLARAARKLALAAGLSADEPIDVWTVVQRLHLTVEYVAQGNTCTRHTAGKIYIRDEARGDPVAHEQAVLHALAHLLIIRESDPAQPFWPPDLESALARATAELMARQVEGLLAIPAPALLAWALANPNATNFEGATHFRVALHRFPARAAESIHGYWTRDEICDREIIRRLIELCVGRVDVVGTNRIDEFIDRDPPIIRNDLVATDALDLLELIAQRAREGNDVAARDILLLLRQTPRPTFARTSSICRSKTRGESWPRSIRSRRERPVSRARRCT